MDEWITIECPYCGQSFEIAVDASEDHQQFVTDCDICCRPMTVSVESHDGQIVRCSTEGG
jgi:Cysteine-rich CPXCG